MKLSQAIAALDDNHITVETKGGAQYRVDADVLTSRDEGDYVYGFRINAKLSSRFTRGRGAQNGDVRWFDLANVKLI